MQLAAPFAFCETANAGSMDVTDLHKEQDINFVQCMFDLAIVQMELYLSQLIYIGTAGFNTPHPDLNCSQKPAMEYSSVDDVLMVKLWLCFFFGWMLGAGEV